MLDREVAEPDRPLERTRWIVDMIIDNEVSSSMHAGTEGSAWLRIDRATFRANTGCRGVRGSVTWERGRLRFTEAIQTDPACSIELEDVDAAMTTILRGEVEFSIDANRLTLIHPDGLVSACTRTSKNSTGITRPAVPRLDRASPRAELG